MRPCSENQIEERKVGNAICEVRYRPLSLSKNPYTGMIATGADIGIPINEYIILLLCRLCLSVANFVKTLETSASGINVVGKETSTFSLPESFSSLRRAEMGGIDFNPHSSYGILFKAWLPYSTTFFCHPDSFFSQFAHVLAAHAVLLSRNDCCSVVVTLSLWQ